LQEAEVVLAVEMVLLVEAVEAEEQAVEVKLLLVFICTLYLQLT
jgi:hypothetical protein